MSGYDFNRDGKVNGTDYYLYNVVFSKGSGSSNSGTYTGGSSAGRWIGYILAAAYLTLWLKGNLGMGFFSWVIAIICACILLKPVLEWFGS